MRNERVVQYFKEINKRLMRSILNEIGEVLLETNDVDAYREKLEDIADITITNMIKQRIDAVRDEIREKYNISNPEVVLVPKQGSILQYLEIRDNINGIAGEQNDDLGIPDEVYQELVDYYRDELLKIKRSIVPEMKANVIALKETVGRLLDTDTVEVNDVILPDTNLYDALEERGYNDPTGASDNFKDLNLLTSMLPAELLDYEKVINDLRASDLKVLWTEYKQNTIGWEHVDEEIHDILDNGILASIAKNIKYKIRSYEIPTSVTLILMFKSLIENQDKYGLSSSIVFGLKVVYDHLVGIYKLNRSVYNMRRVSKNPILGIEGADTPTVYLIGDLLEEYDLDVINAYVLKKFEEAKSKAKGKYVSITTIDKIEDIMADKDKYLNYVISFNRLRAAKRLANVTIALANAYGLQLSNNSPKLIEYLEKSFGSGYDVKNTLYKIAKDMISSKSVDPVEVSNSVINIVSVASIGTSLNDYLSTVLKYDRLVENTTDVNLLSILGAIGVITSDILNDIMFSMNSSKR